MLPRAALRLAGAAPLRAPIVQPSFRSGLFRTYASSRAPPPPPPGSYKVKSKAKPVAASRPPSVASTGSPTEGSRPNKATATPADASPGVLKASNAKAPIAQQQDIDQPEEGGIRAETEKAQTTAENTDPTPQQPLPDLRQGIPSTFDIEFGQGAAKAGEEGADASGRRLPEGDNLNRSDFQTSVDRRRAKVLSYGWYAFALGIIFGGAYLARPYDEDEQVPAGVDPADTTGWAPGTMWRRVRSRFGDQMGYYTEPSFEKLLPDVPLDQRAPYTLVLGLEDLLVHNSWERSHGYRVAKRPGVDYFIRYLSPYYELVLWTKESIGIVDPIIKKLDPFHFIMWPLGKEATRYEGGSIVKDISYLNRDLKKTLILDTQAKYVKNQPDNAIVLTNWMGDPKAPNTGDLIALIPFLEYIATMNIDDVREVIRSFEGKHIPTEFARREALAREQFKKQFAQDNKKSGRSLGGLFGSGFGIKSGGGGLSEGLAEGEMLSDQIRKQGLKQYEALDKQIREEGEKWLKAEAEEQKKMYDESIKEIKKNPLAAMANFWGGGPPAGAQK